MSATVNIATSSLIKKRRDGQVYQKPAEESRSVVSIGSAALDVLAALLLVDGSGSLLDADLLDGHEGSYYAPLNSPNFTGIVTLPASTVVPDGGTIGQAAGPLITFDDTNNELEITGCKVGINMTDLSGSGRDLQINGGWHSYANCNMYNNSALFFTSTDDTGRRIKIFTASSTGDAYFDYYDKLHFRSGSASSADVIGFTNIGSAGFGTISPNAKIESLSTTEQLRLSYDASHYASFIIDATGSLDIDLLSGASINIILAGSGSFAVNTSDLYVANSSGYVGINTTSPDYYLDVNGTGRFTGNLYGDSNVQHLSFVDGWLGNNWQITAAGNAAVENLLVRGAARFRELIIDQLAIFAGSNLMSIARGKIASVDTVNSKVTLEDPNNRGACAFLANDFFWIKAVDIDKNLFSDCRGKITNVTGLVLTLDFGVAGANGSINDIAVGDVIVQRGSSSDSTRRALIYTTVSDSDAPFERIMTGVDSLAAFNDLNNVVYQHGDLSNLASHDIVPASPGFGVYSKNVYLSGKIVASSGSIGGWTINSTTITGGNAILNSTGVLTLGTGDDVAVLSAVDSTYRLWIGDATAADAEFSVTKTGALKAVGALQLGTAVNPSGYGAAIVGNEIYEGSYNGDDSTLLINVSGYGGGYTKYRTTIIGDGKSNALLAVVGGSSSYITLNPDKVYINGLIDKARVSSLIYAYSLSDTPVVSHDSESTSTSTSYTKVKTITLGANQRYNLTLRIKFSIMSTSGAYVYGKIYRNGSPVGTERATTSMSFVEYSQDIADFDPSDTVELYVKVTAGETIRYKNFRICGTHATYGNEVTGTTS